MGGEHPDLALTLHNLATLLASLGRSAEARPLFERALGMMEGSLGPEHPHTVICREAREAGLG
ncbi:MAG TPA: tetratricopeptide repeat protein [Thermoanaerobaculia bacterium]|nr:tetratricopeptide repeat protein [Thermoanaerobaculia bacterium]